MPSWYRALSVSLVQDVMTPEYVNSMSTIFCHNIVMLSMNFRSIFSTINARGVRGIARE